MKKNLKKLSFLLIATFISLQSFAQKRQISGEILDARNLPIPGVTVQIKGTSIGAITDFDGKFNLNAPDEANAVLVFSYLGYIKQEIPLGAKTEFNIILKEDRESLDEIIVVGYGTQKRANLTGAVGQVSSKDIALRPSPDIASALQGQLPGLNIQVNTGDPSDPPDLNIRGFNSINGGGPLVLIDNIEGDISRINPQDIESVTVLKDAASAAIYGARGAFGVILITTKKGAIGDVIVDYTNNLSWTTPTTRTDFITDPYRQGKILDAAWNGYNGDVLTGPMAGWTSDLDWETARMVGNGEIEPFHITQPDGSNKFFYNNDWYNTIFKRWQPSTMHNIAISGGSEKLQAYLSGRYYERETIQFLQDGYVNRYNLKSRINFKPNKWLEVYNSIMFTSEQDKEYSGYDNGYGGPWSNLWRRNKFSFIPTEFNGVGVDIGRDGGDGYGDYPALKEGNNWRLFNEEEFRNTFGAKLTPLKGLEINIDFSNVINQTARTYRMTPFSMLLGNKLEPATAGQNQVTEYRWRNYYKVLNAYGSYNFSLGENTHNFKILAGYNKEDSERDRIQAESAGLLVRNLHNISTATEILEIDGSASAWAIEGYFSRFNYNYKNKYFLEVNARYDGSSRFPEESRWGLFPSASAGWQVNRENFWNSFNGVFSALKLRASYGELGNQSVGLNTFRRNMSVGVSSWLDNGTGITYARAPSALPSVVSWETTKSTNLGIDLGFFRNKLNINFDVYEKNTVDMYLPGKPLPAVFGQNEPRENYASLRNRGFELSINYKNSFTIADKPFVISATASVSNFDGTITKFDNPEGLMSTYWEGQKLGEIYGYHIDGQFQSDDEALRYQYSFNDPTNSLNSVYRFILNSVQNSDWSKLKAGDLKYVDLDGDGEISKGANTLDDPGDIRPIGNAMPKFPFGFNINASYSGFDLSIAGAGVAKQDWAPYGQMFWGTYHPPTASFLRKDLYDNVWSPENTSGKFPQVERGYAALGPRRSLNEINDHLLQDIGFLRIKNLTIGYTMPQQFSDMLKIKKLRFYFSGENIMTWRFGDFTEYLDPEQAGNGINYSNPGSVDGRSNANDYPMGKTISIGLNLSI